MVTMSWILTLTVNIHFLIITFVTHPCNDSWELILNRIELAHIHVEVYNCEILTIPNAIWPYNSQCHMTQCGHRSAFKGQSAQNPKIIAEFYAVSSETSKRNSLRKEDQICRFLFPCLLIFTVRSCPQECFFTLCQGCSIFWHCNTMSSSTKSMLESKVTKLQNEKIIL